jgi:hypothetical protein
MELDGLVTYHSSSQPVPGVEVHASGASGAMVLTNAGGAYGFSGLAGGSLRIEPRKSGGDNGAITSLDAAYILQASVGMRSLTPEQLLACDVTGNGSVTALDAARILQRVVGSAATLPVAQSCGSDWAFVPEADAFPNQSIFEPTLGSAECQAGAIAFAPLPSDAPHQDFRAILFGDCTGNWQPQSGGALARRSDAWSARLGRPRRSVGGEIVVPLHLDGEPFHALEATVAFDAARLLEIRARMADATDAVLRSNAERGRLVLGLASAELLDPSGSAIVEIVYRLKRGDRRADHLRIVDLSLDE